MTACIRPKAVCVCWRGDSILVAPDHDAVKDETFFGPPGGGIEFGERANDAVRREFREELDVELVELQLRGVLENLFTHNAEPGHEIVFVFEGRLADPALYDQDELIGREGTQPFVARWIPLEEFAVAGAPPLYPHGLLELLRAPAE